LFLVYGDIFDMGKDRCQVFSIYVFPIILRGWECMWVYVCVYAHTHKLHVRYSDVSPGVRMRHLHRDPFPCATVKVPPFYLATFQGRAKALSNRAMPKLNFLVSGRISVVMSTFSVFLLSYGRSGNEFCAEDGQTPIFDPLPRNEKLCGNL